MKKLQLTFNNKYKTSHRIGLTQKSEIYKVYQIATEEQLAIKIESYDQNSSTPSDLEKEAKIYRLVKGGVGIPNLYWYGLQQGYRVMVTDILGPSLEQLLQYCKGIFSLKTVLLIADQIIDRIQWIHQKSLVYNDIDSQNFLVGLGKKADKIFIIDLGNCRKYLDQQNNHIFISKESNPIKNNIRFKSIHGHINKSNLQEIFTGTSRRDDLQSFGYLMVYLLKGELPWDDLQETGQAQRQLQIKEKKASIPLAQLCQNLPGNFYPYFYQEQFQKYFNYVKTLGFEQEPDYVWIKRLFKDLFDCKGFVQNKIMDWAQRHSY